MGELVFMGLRSSLLNYYSNFAKLSIYRIPTLKASKTAGRWLALANGNMADEQKN
jgi:hypothetical protein